MPEGEWDEFMATLGRDLPVTFRINGSGRFADHLRDKLQSDFFSHFSNGDLMVRTNGRVPCAMHHARAPHGACASPTHVLCAMRCVETCRSPWRNA